MFSYKSELAAPESVLYDHYGAFEAFVKVPPDSSLVPPSPRQAKSRERLHRMPRVPFVELSVDVYDELQRRQAIAAANEAGVKPTVPDALAPREGFHPKRNTTREHLAVLQSSRFRDLVLDVFFEVARRLSKTQAENGAARKTDPNVMLPTGPTGPIPKMMSPVTAPTQRQATTANGSTGHSSSNSMSTGGSNNLGRPLPKTLQTSTVVPMKSTMVERSDDSGDDESVRSVLTSARSTQPGSLPQSENNVTAQKPILQQRSMSQDTSQAQNASPPISTPAQRSPQHSPQSHARFSTSSASSHDRSQAHSERHVTDLTTQFESLQDRHTALQTESINLKNELLELKAALTQKDDQVRFLKEALENEKRTAKDAASSVEEELFRTRAANKKMNAEIQVLETEFEKLRARSAVGNDAVDNNEYQQLQRNYDDLLADHEILKIKLQDQHEVTEQVRGEALKFFGEMKAVSELETANRDRTERLSSQVRTLKAENNDLREKLALGHMRDTLSTPDRKQLAIRPSHIPASSPFISDNGVIFLDDFARFQASIDALVRASADANGVNGQSYFFEMVRSVATCTKNIIADTDAFEQPDEPTIATKLRSRVSIASNNVVVAAKNHVRSGGLSPLSVLDASVADLVESVVDLVKAAKLKEAVPIT
ncbi:hypothetical protein V1517DRAFT_337059 [Lipomyces orientalis]|uniref:Uncharacterized protein n=1 Tax=Lipomyces orientalis TaxID=1233043 RepID=A0ACC3TST2_9ASCO